MSIGALYARSIFCLQAVALVVPPEHAEDPLPWLAGMLEREPARVAKLQEEIERVAPRCQYSVHGGRPQTVSAGEPWDAFEHALAGIAAARI
ncbi:hypothetical protein T492DRAFT_891004 [Pavlovales sp. CCMP2436]|nr:hypothetical protein T492DRAFT_891004 [Pavlovales sp. CCMP2436]